MMKNTDFIELSNKTVKEIAAYVVNRTKEIDDEYNFSHEQLINFDLNIASNISTIITFYMAATVKKEHRKELLDEITREFIESYKNNLKNNFENNAEISKLFD